MHSEVETTLAATESYRSDRFWVDSRFGQMYVSRIRRARRADGMDGTELFWYMDWTLNAQPEHDSSYKFYSIISKHEIDCWAAINTYAVAS